MSDVSSATDVLSSYSINKAAVAETAKKKSNELGQDAFLKLMITQMKSQDPLSPEKNSEFVAQLAQFSSVQGIEKLNSNFSTFSSGFNSNQALQASSLVGRSVGIESATSILSGGENGMISGTIAVPASTSDMTMNVYDTKGALVATIPIGAAVKGDTRFRFDGQNIEVNDQLLDWSSGESALAPGTYKFEILATQDGKTEQLATTLSANVNSVTVGENGNLVLNLAGVGPTDMSKVKQFN